MVTSSWVGFSTNFFLKFEDPSCGSVQLPLGEGEPGLVQRSLLNCRVRAHRLWFIILTPKVIWNTQDLKTSFWAEFWVYRTLSSNLCDIDGFCSVSVFFNAMHRLLMNARFPVCYRISVCMHFEVTVVNFRALLNPIKS